MKLEKGQYPVLFMYLSVLFLALGILSGECWQSVGEYKGYLFIAVIALGLISLYGILKEKAFVWLSLLGILFVLGILRYDSEFFLREDNILHYEGQQVEVEGIIEGAPIWKKRDDKWRLTMTVDVKNIYSGDSIFKGSGKLLLYSEKSIEDKGDRLPSYQDGDLVFFSGKIKRLRDYQNPGRINTVMAKRAEGITAYSFVREDSYRVVPQNKITLVNFSEGIRNHYRQSMENIMPQYEGAAIFAMLFGGYNGLKEELVEAFSIVGLIHILSVSGSHVSLLAATIGMLCRIFYLPARIAAILGIFTILVYGILAGGVPPVIRSSLMGIAVLMGEAIGRERESRYILSLTALGMLLHSPLLLYDVGFQLSFGSTAGLIYISPLLRKIGEGRLNRYLQESISVSLGAQLMVIPLFLWYFHNISPSSLLANLLILPIVELVILLGLGGGIIACLFPFLGKLFLILASLLMGGVYSLARILASMPGSRIYLPVFSWWIGIIYYIMIIFLVTEDKKRIYMTLQRAYQHKSIKYGIILVLVFCIPYSIWELLQREMQVHFIDVGQGDAVLVITPRGKGFMIDTGGTRNGNYDIGKRVAVPYLLHYGIDSLEYIFLTHAHEDHAGGTGGIIEALPVKHIITANEGREAYLRVLQRGRRLPERLNLVPGKQGQHISIDGVEIELLYAPVEANLDGSGNEFSNVIRVTYGNISFLFTGDLSKEQENVILSQGSNVKARVLKVAHHGSKTSNSEEFLAAVDPSWSVISVGYDNSFGHPAPEVLKSLEKYSKRGILRTDRDGAIVFKTNGITMDVSHWGGKA